MFTTMTFNSSSVNDYFLLKDTFVQDLVRTPQTYNVHTTDAARELLAGPTFWYHLYWALYMLTLIYMIITGMLASSKRQSDSIFWAAFNDNSRFAFQACAIILIQSTLSLWLQETAINCCWTSPVIFGVRLLLTITIHSTAHLI